MALRVLASHTGGEPTLLVLEGLPELPGTVNERLIGLRDDYDWIRTSLCLEPRGNEVAIGAALFPPSIDGCLHDVVFFNNTSYLGMCGHGTIGVMASLAWLGHISPGKYCLNTVAGVVPVQLHDPNTVSFDNVASFRYLADVKVRVPNHGDVVGDVAYGGNWFFLTTDGSPAVRQDNIQHLMEFTSALMDTLETSGITGRDGAKIDHVEVFGPPCSPHADSKNFVLCPGKQYDRSPCGTGTSAKLATLFASGKIAEGQIWRQESIIGSTFEGSVREVEGGVIPKIQGQAFVTADTRVILDPGDPFQHGF